MLLLSIRFSLLLSLSCLLNPLLPTRLRTALLVASLPVPEVVALVPGSLPVLAPRFDDHRGRGVSVRRWCSEVEAWGLRMQPSRRETSATDLGTCGT